MTTSSHDRIELVRTRIRRRWHWRLVSRTGELLDGSRHRRERPYQTADLARRAAKDATECWQPMYGGTHVGDGAGRVLQWVVLR